jgi:hypothetical protein
MLCAHVFVAVYGCAAGVRAQAEPVHVRQPDEFGVSSPLWCRESIRVGLQRDVVLCKVHATLILRLHGAGTRFTESHWPAQER